MSGKKKLLQYDDGSKRQFETYFIKPKKRGRPKNKKKRGRPKAKVVKTKKKQTMMQESESGHAAAPIDLTAKQQDELDARLEGTVAKCSRRQRLQRINWDAPDYSELRQIIADSWVKKHNLYSQGESFGRFCHRMGIDRNVLKRYLSGKYVRPELRKVKRGRPSLLTESVMRHLCEGV